MHTRGAVGGTDKALGVSGWFSTVGQAAASATQAPQIHQDPLPRVQSPLIELESNDTTRAELVKVIIMWLVGQGFTTSAQVLREEATAQLRDEHNQRKSVRAICRSIDEQNWESAQKHLRKLQNRVPNRPQGAFQIDSANHLTSLTRSLPFLLAQQQFLELVDEDDGQRAFAFFMRSLKPFESTISREHFQKLNYLLTCKTVAESAGVYPQFRGWTAEVGRAQLLRYIDDVAGDCLVEPYCRQGNITGLGAVSAPGAGAGAGTLLPLETITSQSLAFQLLANEYPQLTHDREPVRVRSLLLPLIAQMPPSEPLLRLDVTLVADALRLTAPVPVSATGALGSVAPSREPLRLTACQPFLSVPAVAVGTHEGHLLWIQLDAAGPSAFAALRSRFGPQQPQPEATGDGGALIFRHKYAMRGMQRHRSRLLAWGGPQVVLFDFSSRMVPDVAAPCGPSSCAPAHEAAMAATGGGAAAGEVESAVVRTVGAYSGNVDNTGRCHVPLGSARLGAEGKEVPHIFTHGADVLSSCFFPCGTIIAAGLSDGTVAVWDTAKGAKMFENTFGDSPIVSVRVNHTGSTYYAATKEGSIYVVDVVTGMVISTLTSPIAGELASITLSPSSMLLLASYRGGALRLWDVLLGKQLQYHFLGAERSARASYPVTFGCQDDQIIAGSSDGCIYAWKLTRSSGKTSSSASVGNGTVLSNAGRGLVDVFAANGFTPAAAAARSAPVTGLPHGVVEDAAVRLRWSQGSVVRPATQLPLHRESITDVKMESVYLVSCAGDGMVCICSNGAR